MDAVRRNTGERLREARRSQGLRQSEVAEAIGCTQSAVSMFESGRPDVLARDKVEALAKRLGVSLSGDEVDVALPPAPAGRRYCPHADCPSNVPLVVAGALRLTPALPRRLLSVATRCPACGEVLEVACPNPKCRAPVGVGPVCAACGQSYVQPPELTGAAAEEWARRRRIEIESLRLLLREEEV
jgi:transcriptional regulator with XRE-family HTH domain